MIRRVSFLVLATLVALPVASAAGPFMIATDRLNYSGTVTDPNGGVHSIQAASNGPRNTLTDARDGSIYMTPSQSVAPGSGVIADAIGGYFDYSVFMTAWYYSTDQATPANSGSGNPNNTNTGFVQMYDDDGDKVTSSEGYWDASLTAFSVSVTGANAGPSEFGRLWPAPVTGGAAALSAGTFSDYEFGYEATFSAVALLDNGWYYSAEHPSSVSGFFRGTFVNASSTPSMNGEYLFDFEFGMENWAWNQGDALKGAFSPSFFAASEVRRVPEPVTLALLGLGLFGAACSARRRMP